MEFLEIVSFRDESLPASLQKIFHDWEIQRTVYYAIYTIKLEYIGDEHLEPLDDAFKARTIQAWTCSEGWSSANYNII